MRFMLVELMDLALGDVVAATTVTLRVAVHLVPVTSLVVSEVVNTPAVAYFTATESCLLLVLIQRLAGVPPGKAQLKI